MQRRHLLPTAVALLLLAASLAAIQPMFTEAKKPVATGCFALDASGMAIVINNKNAKRPASLMLNGLVRADGKDGKNVKLFEGTGTLTVGLETFQLMNGKGEYSKKNGKIELEAKSKNDKKLELDLHGTVGADGHVSFTNPQSKLSSRFFLELMGTLTITAPCSSSTSISSILPTSSSSSSSSTSSTTSTTSSTSSTASTSSSSTSTSSTTTSSSSSSSSSSSTSSSTTTTSTTSTTSGTTT